MTREDTWHDYETGGCVILHVGTEKLYTYSDGRKFLTLMILLGLSTKRK